MTFGGLAAWQAWVLIAAAASLAAALFLIRVRPPRTFVPSLLLWRRVLDERRELTLWERIRRAVSLVLTVMIAAALAFAAAGPLPHGSRDGRAMGRVLVVLDASWSMQATTTNGDTRWQRALAEARRIVSASPGSEVALATTGEGLVEGPTRDAGLIDAALARLEPRGSGRAPWPWPHVAGASAVHFITDGAAPRPLDPSVIVHSVFDPAPNAAITAFELRPALAGSALAEAYLEVANFAPTGQKIRLLLSRGRTPLFDRTLDVAPGEALRQTIQLERGGDPRIEARIEADHDALDADDRAVLWLHRAQPLRVLVVGDGVEWLATAFEGNPDFRAVFREPAQFAELSSPETAAFDVLLFDSWAPAAAPSTPALFFAPPPDTPWLTARSPNRGPADAPAGPLVEANPRWLQPGSHPVVQGVDPFTLRIDRARSYPGAGLEAVAESSRRTPLVYVQETPATRRVVVTFTARESNLAGAPGFPVLLGNSLEWLTRPVAGSREPGFAAFDALLARLTGPDGNDVPLARLGTRTAAFLNEPGVYVANAGGSQNRIAVNALSAQLSNLTRTTLADSPGNGGDSEEVAGNRPWWLYFAATALGLLLLEWWTWQRRITV